MISIVCVYNNKKILDNLLLKSLAGQSSDFELIIIDNTGNRFNSAAGALNHGGTISRGDYIMFIHQDMWLGTKTFIEDAENIMRSVPDAGIAGVAGVDNKSEDWKANVKYSISVFGTPWWDDVGPVKKPEEVLTLDECLLIVPRPVFDRLKFDDKNFDGWDCYGADYCLAAGDIGLKTYVIPLPCSHSCMRADYALWEFKELHRYQKRLYGKYGKKYNIIHTWMGNISRHYLIWIKILSILKPLYLKLFPDFQVRLEKELAGCSSVLDLGCGHHSPIYRRRIPYSVGVEIFLPSLIESKRLTIHNDYIQADIRKLEFKNKSFDAVLAIDVLQNIEKDEGIELINKINQWARKKIIIKTTNGFIRQSPYNNNSHLEHVSGWKAAELKSLGFSVHGIEGLKFLEKDEEYQDKLQYRFWRERIANLTQVILYHFLPGLARQLFAVRKIN